MTGDKKNPQTRSKENKFSYWDDPPITKDQILKGIEKYEKEKSFDTNGRPSTTYSPDDPVINPEEFHKMVEEFKKQKAQKPAKK